MSLSIQSMPTDIVTGIFSFLPAAEVAGVCRFVSKDWNTSSRELLLWQKFADQFGMVAEDTVEKIEKQIRNYLQGKITISTEEQLAEKLTSFFSSITTGETRALKYCSASNPKAVGFYMKSKDPNVLLSSELSTIIKDTKMAREEALEVLLKKLKGLTITGKDTADLQKGDFLTASEILSPQEIIQQKHVSHDIEFKYFNSPTV